MTAARPRLVLLGLALAGYAGVFTAYCVLERPALGIGHFYYVPIAVVAIVAGPVAGVVAGAVAAGLYDIGNVVNPHVPATLQGLQTLIRLTTFSAVGLVVGTYARSNTRLVRELSQLAERDRLTGLPNTRAFEAAIDEFLRAEAEFTLLVGDVDELRRLGHDGDELLRRIAEMLTAARRPRDVVARIGGDEFAVLTPAVEQGQALAAPLEQLAGSVGASVTFGWATYPRDGTTALALYRAADERLYARKLARGFRRDAVTPSLRAL